MSKIPDLEAWAIFARVAELRSFSAAANALGLSNATVSKAVSRLEARLGVRLLHRTTRTLSLTPSGQALSQRATLLLAEAEAAEEAARAEASAPRGLVRIAAPMSFGINHVAPILPDLLERYPDLSIDLRLDDAAVDLVEAGIDVALRIGTLVDSSLRARKLRDVRLMVAAAPAYLERQPEIEHPADLARHACFAYGHGGTPGRWRLIGPGGQEESIRPAGPLTTNNGEAMLPALAAARGISLLPDFILEPEFAAGRLVRVLPAWEAPPLALHLVMPSPGPRPARVAATIDYLATRLGA